MKLKRHIALMLTLLLSLSVPAQVFADTKDDKDNDSKPVAEQTEDDGKIDTYIIEHKIYVSVEDLMNLLQYTKVSPTEYTYENKTIVFDGKSTVFFGVNGTGKSTILRAINVMFSRIVQKIVQSRYKQTINMTKEDIRFGESKTSVEVEISLANTNKKIKYKRSLEKKMNRLSYSQDSLNEIAELFEELY